MKRPSEVDDEVRQSLDPDLLPLYEKIRRSLKGDKHEAFLHYVHDHPHEAAEAREAVADFKLKQHLRPMLDFYETPSWAVRAVCPILPVTSTTRILDPGCGSGAILRELGAQYPENELLGIEKDDARYQACAASTDLEIKHADFLTYDGKHDLIVSNPPYSHAIEFVQHALTLAPVVCMLLRLPWLASQRRAQWHRENPCHVAVLPRRPSFTIDGKTDATEYAWFLWGTSRKGSYEILRVEAHDRVKKDARTLKLIEGGG